jgi:hypothetical protein
MGRSNAIDVLRALAVFDGTSGFGSAMPSKIPAKNPAKRPKTKKCH